MKSNREDGKMQPGEESTSRRIASDSDAPSLFLDLAGSVDVPSETKGMSWRAIKAATWRRRAALRK
jgi:hypothetical protein